ncbi:MAG TPA: guanylate kinase [Candidatus Acidoferrum sp.]|jgi:guanylate kinase|nr:guanylate kinase [Candidatus Acidoferrum sp.]
MSVPAHKPLVYIISAPSGSGKSTLVNELLKSVRDLDFSISYTTRLPRGSEENGKQYYFVSRSEFEKMIRDAEFLEHAEVFGNYYGTARRFLREAEQERHDLLLDIDVQGAAQIQQKLPEAISIFILPPDRTTLEERLRKRSEDREEVIQRRLITASREIENYDRYNYILVNNILEESSAILQAIVRSERLLRSGKPLSEEDAKTVALADRCRLANARDRLKRILDSFKPPDDSRTG